MKHQILRSATVLAAFMLFKPIIVGAADSGTFGADGDNLTWTINDSGTLTISGNGDMTDIPWSEHKPEIKSVIIENGVTSIGRYAFANCDNLTSITISDSVTSIGGMAFFCCRNLTSVTIPDSVTGIGYSAFSLCDNLNSVYISDLTAYLNIDFDDYYSNPMCNASKLYLNNECVTEINLPYGTTQIPPSAFYHCDSLTKVTIPDTVTNIGSYAFSGCSLTEVVIPDSVASIGDYAFFNCDYLTDVAIGSGVKSIGNYSFSACDVLTSIIIPDSVTSIGENAFYYCNELASASIGNGVITIGNSAFSSCTKLENLTIGNSVMSIGNNAFNGCSSLTNVRIPDNVLSIGNGAFGWCYNLSSAAIGDNIIRIGDNAFCGCRELTHITFPGNVSNIGREAFSLCDKLNIVTLSKSVKKIENGAFVNCEAIEHVEYGGDENEWNEMDIGVKNDCLKKATIYYGSDNAPVPKVPISVNVNNKAVEFDVAPQLVNGRTLVPLRAIFEALGASVDWDQKTQTITSTKNDITIKMTLDRNIMYVNDKEIALDVPAAMVNYRTLVPARAVSEAYNANVEWDKVSKTVKIMSAD